MTSRRIHVKRFLIVAVLGLAISITLSACWNSPYTITDGAPHLNAAYVEGTWAKSGPGGIIAEYKFISDGHFVATNIPNLREPKDGVGNVVINWNQLISGTGTWAIRKDDQDPPIVNLDYDPASIAKFEPVDASDTAGDYSQLWSLEVKHVKSLFIAVGDADEQFRFNFRKLEPQKPR